MKSKWKSFSISLALVLLPYAASAQSLPGVVLDAGTGAPIAGASVLVLHERRVLADLRTDSLGRVALPVQPAAGYILHAIALGYESFTMRLQDQTTSFTALLVPQPIKVAGVSATVERRDPYLDLTGFYQRKRSEIGTFVDRAQLERRNPARVSDMFQAMPSVRLVCNPSGTRCAVVTRRFVSTRMTNCPLALYLDGIRMRGVTIDDLIPVNDLLGMEVYAGAARVPAQYGGPSSACGVILLWTRFRN